MIDTDNFSKKFGDLTAVDNLTLHVNDGEVFGFLGPNGVGKTISAVIPTLAAMQAGASVFMLGIDEVTFHNLGYFYFPNWTIASLLLILVPVAVVLSVLFSVIVSSRVNDVHSASSFGILMFFPFLAIYLASETDIISLGMNNLLIISGIFLAVDVALFFVNTGTFHREEILTKGKQEIGQFWAKKQQTGGREIGFHTKKRIAILIVVIIVVTAAIAILKHFL